MPDNYVITRITQTGYTKQPNAILRDPELTSDAKVVIFFLLSLSNGFHLTTKSIISTIHLSKGRAERAIELLQKTGYISISKVKDGTKYGGYTWQIADVHGNFRNPVFRSTEIPEYGNSGVRDSESTEIQSTENGPIYEQPIGEKLIVNNQRNEEPKNEQLNLSSSPTPSPIQTAGLEGSEVLSRKEYLFQQFLKKYPKKPTGSEFAATKKAFFEIPNLEYTFDSILAGLEEWCNSVDWNKEGGRYITKPLNFITTQKWEEIPRGINTEIDPGLAKFMNVPMEVYL